MPQIENLVDKLATRLPPEGARLLDAVRSCAESSGLRAFLVGGTVRDLLLGRDSLDVDIVVQGDAVQLARTIDLVRHVAGAAIKLQRPDDVASLRMQTFVIGQLLTTRGRVHRQRKQRNL